GGNYMDIYDYINTSKATEIIMGILLSVVIAFSVGALVQYLSRILLSFEFRKKAKILGAMFGGIALTAITYFILIKGLKGATFVSDDVLDYIKNNTNPIIIGSLVLWTLISYIISIVFKYDVYKLIIIVGTFALALA